MGQTYSKLDKRLTAFIEQQPLFFVATAPLGAEGHVNVSPKGGTGTLRVLGPIRVAYLDMLGSGIETVAHLRENGRITLMFCAFSGPPMVLRLYGQGRVVQPGEPEFDRLLARFEPTPEMRDLLRSIIVVEVSRIADSCGFVVPNMEVVGERDQLYRWANWQQRTYGDRWKAAYQFANNRKSIDGLPALDPNVTLDDAERKRFASDGRAI